eukprot:TRINITY_DN7709_c0_g1_i1.p1 TRINITY_DN7709_c0_g1~~TRINITY_DN7709_c0_g1_i1.p1  ORF type:complete len:339 (+),score=90.90 TRINITY_DN7709_c0_g1_i1:147-1019(+)
MERITKQIQLIYQPMLSMNALDYLQKIEKEEKIFHINETIDKMIGGGLSTKDILEIQGSSGTGKTQICFLISYALSYKYEKKVIYVDTNNSFAPSRILEIVKKEFYGVSVGEDDSDTVLKERAQEVCNDYQNKYLDALSRIDCHKVYEIFELMNFLEKIENKLIEEKNKNSENETCLIIIDCIASLLSPILFVKHPSSFSLMNDCAKRLKYLAVQYNVSIVLTNYTVQEGKKAALGEFWSFVPDISLFIESVDTKGDRKCITVSKSKKSSKTFNFFSITQFGIVFDEETK